MKMLLLFPILLGTVVTLNAQTRLEQLINDPDISWLKTYTLNLNPHLDSITNQYLGFKKNHGFLIKFQARPAHASTLHWNPDPSLTAQLLGVLKEGTLRAYHDRYLTKIMSHKELMNSIEMPFLIDDITSGGTEPVSWIQPEDIVGYHLYGVFYYHKTEHLFKSEVISVAPMLNNDQEELDNPVILCWIPVQPIHKTDLDALSISWAARTVTHVSHKIPLKALSGTDKTAKSTMTVEEVWSDFFASISNASSTLYDPHTLLGSHPIDVEETIAVLDTVEYTDEDGYLITTVYRTEVDPTQLHQTCIVQDWIWKEQQLYIRYLGFAPMISRYDGQGNFLHQEPLFYIRMDEED